MKYGIMLGVVVGAFVLGWISRPKPPPAKPPQPTKTDTMFVATPSIPERVQERVFLPGADVLIPVRYEVTIFDTVSIPCAEIAPRRRILSAEFGKAYGDTTLVASELMTSNGNSLVFRSQIESLYTDGTPLRIWNELDGIRIEWQEIPTIRVNSCSIGKTLLSGLVGCGACSLLTGLN